MLTKENSEFNIGLCSAISCIQRSCLFRDLSSLTSLRGPGFQGTKLVTSDG